MTQLLAEISPYRASRRLDPLSAHLQRIRDLTGRDTLLESCDGEIVAYALRSQPSSAVCTAVLARSAQALRPALRHSRSVALSTAGPVRTSSLDDQAVTVVPVSGGDGTGRVWLFGADAVDLDASLQGLIEELGALAARLAQVEVIDVAGIVAEEQPLPRGFAACSTYLLVADSDLPSGVAVERLRQAARDATPRLLVEVGVHDGTDIALIACSERLTIDDVAAMIDEWAVPYGIRSLITPWHSDALPEVRQALRAAPAGCSLPSQVRSRLFLHLMCDAADALGIPGEDPVAALVDSHPDFARALLAWLDTHGDIPAAATVMKCHPNTLRYRVRRAGELLPGDLSDSAFRLEVHLRLISAGRAVRETS